MKSKTKLSGIFCVTVFFLITFMFFSCKKYEEKSQNPQISKYSNMIKSGNIETILQWQPPEDSVYLMIKKIRNQDSAFRDNRMSDKLPSIPIEHVLWNLLANSNFDYANFNDSLAADVVNSFIVTLPIDDENSTVDSIFLNPYDMIAAYVQIEDTLVRYLDAEKFIQMVMINVSSLSTDLKIEVKIITSYEHTHIPVLPENTNSSPIPYTQVYPAWDPSWGAAPNYPILNYEITNHINPCTPLGNQKHQAAFYNQFYVPFPHYSGLIATDYWPDGNGHIAYMWNKMWAGNYLLPLLLYGYCNGRLGDAWWFCNHVRYAYSNYDAILWKMGCYAQHVDGANPDFVHFFVGWYAKAIPFTHDPQ
ncbi:MAG: hypothetical protein NTU44_16430 [Bacteroidetes bacterium]|nr:hypothetical protein [Bacteroidota bacterium]